MRFERIRIDAFGALTALDTGTSPLGGFVVVLGPNEAGKSTLFEFLRTMLYGFHPATRATHPFAPWNGSPAAGEVDLMLANGARCSVHRQLRSSPTGTLVRGESSTPLRNREAPFVAHVPAVVYRQVFAVALSELAGLDDRGWAAAREGLLGTFGARDLRPVTAVVDELKREAGTRWRPNQRGNQTVRDLGERIAVLRTRRPEVRRADDELRATHQHVGELRAQLDEARRSRASCRARLEQAREQLPLVTGLARLAELDTTAGPADELHELDELRGSHGHPGARLQAIRLRQVGLRERIDDLIQARAAPAAAAAAFGPDQEEFLAAEPELDALSQRLAGAEAERAGRARIDADVQDLDRRLADVLTLLPLAQPDEAALDEIDLPEVRRLLPEMSALQAFDASPPAGGPGRTRHLWSALLGGSFLGGALLLGWGLVSGRAWTSLAGVGLLGVAGVLLVLWLRGRAARARLRREAEARRARLGLVSAELREALGDRIPLPPVSTSPLEWIHLLERGRELRSDRRLRRQAGDEVDRRLERLEREARDLVQRIPLSAPIPGDTGEALRRARAEIRGAARAQEAARAATRELARLDRELGRLRAEGEALDLEAGALREKIERLGDGDLEQGTRVAEARLRARAQAEELRQELVGQYGEEVLAAHEDAASLRARETDVETEAELEHTLSETVERLTRQVRGLEKDLEHLARRETLEALDGEIADLESRRLQEVRARDRLWLMSRVVADADRWLREEHQGDALRRAGSHLATLTAGRYDRLLADSERDRSFLVSGPAAASPLPAEFPLSRGTREQVYLALRLALLEPLDRAGERLPLMLDEVLVNWDARRREGGLALLTEVARERQVLMFTCHGGLAESATRRGAHLLELGSR